MEIKIITEPISKNELKKVAEKWFGDMVKGVVDIEKKIIVLGGEMHADSEALLLENGSRQENLWGINLYPFENNNRFIQYAALINIRPKQKNRDMEIQDPTLRKQIRSIVNILIK